jgi:imidazoleglycerol-phosphate dehydratase
VAKIERKTAETEVAIELNLDGTGQANVATGVGFLDHMLTLLARHGLFDLNVRAQGDVHVDFHHTVEDVGICLGRAIRDALGDKRGLSRYGSLALPMEETLMTTAVDLSGRAWLVMQVRFPTEKIGAFDTELVETFWQAVAANGLFNLHFVLHHGSNSHHIAEAMWKGFARALRQAVAIDPRERDVPSSKGTLSG